VDRVQPAAPLAKSYLKDAAPTQVAGDRVLLSFDPEFADSCEKLKVPRSLRAVQNALEWALGHPVVLELTVGKAAPAQPAPTKSKTSGKDWVKDPAVKRTLEMFNGNIVDVRE